MQVFPLFQQHESSYIGHLMGSAYFLQLKLFFIYFLSLSVVAHLVVPASWSSCLLRLAIFIYFSWYQLSLL